jgi:NADH-quinone oxidoreductase subunit L
MMTAFYMFRLMSMTFFGSYRGPAWETGGHGDVAVAAAHGTSHPADPHAHGQAQRTAHEVSHGPAEPHDAHDAHDAHGHDAHGHAAADDAHAGHGHGPWHGPHESPTPMTFPLMALALGAIVAGFFGIPAALGSSMGVPNAIEEFLEPSFTADGHGVAHEGQAAHAETTAAAEHQATAEPAGEHHEGEHEVSTAAELGLMGFSVLIALTGIGLAWRFYVTNPEISEGLAARFSGAHRVLSNKYYVDEAYNATVISGTHSSARGLWAVDRTVVDGAVNGAGWLTQFSAWLSGLTDKRVVDGAVNLVGWSAEESSYWFRRLQTGLVQNYALLMLFGVVAFVGVYLIVR